VVSAVAVEPPKGELAQVPRAQRRALLEEKLLASGLAYGTGAADPAIELAHDAPAGARAFALLVVGLLRTCATAGALSGAPLFVGNAGIASDRAASARRAQLVALLAAAGGETEAAAALFARPLDTPSLLARLARKAALRLSRRFLAEGALFAGLPLHNGLCAIEVRTCATLALATFGHGRLSPAAAHLATGAALGWRAALVELLAALAAVQEGGRAALKGYDQVIRSQRLPAREARLLRRALNKPRPPEVLAAGMYGDALRRFALSQVLLAALVDGRFEPAEVAFVERLAVALGAGEGEVSAMETAIAAFYRQHTEALTALRLAETPEGLPHALTTRVQEAVVDNLDRMLQEIRETGELAELLAKAAAGASLSSAERLKVRKQLIDLAKTIPALAIFAAPGGMILLPILLKLLPFNLLPSSFVDEAPRFALPPRRPGARGTEATPPRPHPPLKKRTSG
jgi:LETM1-like protein